MARPNPRRQQRLEGIAKRQRAVGQKIGRYERRDDNPVHLRGSEYDPRRPMSEVRTYSAKQLAAYERRLDRFVSRGTQFEGVFGGQPVTRRAANAYRAVEEAQNALARQYEASVLGLKLPGQDLTVGQRLGMLPSDGKSVPQANRNFRIFQEIHRPFFSITSPTKLAEYTEQMKAKLKKNYLGKTVEKRLNSLFALLEGSDNSEFIEKVKALSLAEQHNLLDYSTFATIAEDRFYPNSEDQRQRDIDYELRNGVSRADDIRDQLEQVLDWVVNDVTPATRGERGNEYREQTPAGPIRTRNVGGGEPGTNAGPIPIQGRVERTPAGPIPIQRDIFGGHQVGDFIAHQRSGAVWQVVARVTDTDGTGVIRAKNVRTGREQFVKPGNYKPLNS